MAYNLICNCSDRIATEIKSLSQLKEIEDFFSEQLSKGVFTELPPRKPYYKFKKISWYADKWYKCKICGCLWEYVKPDFPASGSVRKFPNGKYRERDF